MLTVEDRSSFASNLCLQINAFFSITNSPLRWILLGGFNPECVLGGYSSKHKGQCSIFSKHRPFRLLFLKSAQAACFRHRGDRRRSGHGHRIQSLSFRHQKSLNRNGRHPTRCRNDHRFHLSLKSRRRGGLRHHHAGHDRRRAGVSWDHRHCRNSSCRGVPDGRASGADRALDAASPAR